MLKHLLVIPLCALICASISNAAITPANISYSGTNYLCQFTTNNKIQSELGFSGQLRTGAQGVAVGSNNNVNFNIGTTENGHTIAFSTNTNINGQWICINLGLPNTLASNASYITNKYTDRFIVIYVNSGPTVSNQTSQSHMYVLSPGESYGIDTTAWNVVKIFTIGTNGAEEICDTNGGLKQCPSSISIYPTPSF